MSKDITDFIQLVKLNSVGILNGMTRREQTDFTEAFGKMQAEVVRLTAERDALRAQLTEAWTAGRDAAAAEIDCEGCGGKCYDPANCWQSAAYQIRSLTPPEYNATPRDETAV